MAPDAEFPSLGDEQTGLVAPVAGMADGAFFGGGVGIGQTESPHDFAVTVATEFHLG